MFGIYEKDEMTKEGTDYSWQKKGRQTHRKISDQKQEHVLIFDFGLVLKHQTDYHSGLIFSAVTPYCASGVEDRIATK